MNIFQEITPPCPYFTKCGGCSLQHIANHGEYKNHLFKQALANIKFNGILHPLLQINTKTRRRAVFKVHNQRLSFNRFHSKETVAIAYCLLLEDRINDLINPINRLLNKLNIKIEQLHLTNSDTGIELLLYSNNGTNLQSETMLAAFAHEHDIARIAWQKKNQAAFIIIQRKAVQLLFDIPIAVQKLDSAKQLLKADRDRISVDLPVNSFLQVSKESADLMTEIILQHLDNSRLIELYSGCGSFTIPIAKKTCVLAVEGSDAAVLALATTAKTHQLPIQTIRQDLYQQPILTELINNYAQVLINPPRNGATPQIQQIAQSHSVKTVILVSCSVKNFIRDAKILLQANFHLSDVYLIDQFLYTEHLEVIGIFKKYI